MENSLDAGADSIEVKLHHNGLLKIEVEDNGSGIEQSDVPFLCKPHYTSKIVDDSDLGTLASYGFRGEALYSLCSVADVSVVTKTAQDEYAQHYHFDVQGKLMKRWKRLVGFFL